MYPLSFSQHPLAEKIDQARHHNFMKLALPHLISGLFTAALIYFLYQDHAIDNAALIWLSMNCLLLLSTLVFYAIYHLRPNWFSIPQWGRVTLLVTALWAISWSLPPFILLDTQQPLYIGLMVAFLVAMATVPAPVMVHYPLAYVVFISLPLGSLWFRTLSAGLDDQQIIQWLTPFLWVSLLIYGWDLHKTIIEGIRLRLEHQAAHKEAEQANLAKSRFIAAASHDIRQPLQAATLFLSALKSQTNEPQAEELSQRLEKSLDGMSDLLNGLLDISKLDAEVIETNPLHCDLAELFTRLSTQHRPLAQQAGLEFTVNSTPTAVYADPVLLERVLNNLLSNAIRYTSYGHVSLRAQVAQEQVTIHITDTGPGIPSCEQQHIFDEFYQLPQEQQPTGQKLGLGLGLSIVKRLCSLQHWPLQLKSKSGEGSCFSVTLPKGELKQSQPPKPLTLHKLEHLKVLLIDDNREVREGLSRLLSQWQCGLWVADGPKQALEIMHSQPECQQQLNLIISDFRLTDDMNGLELIAALRQLTGRKTEAIIITGDTGPSELHSISKSGMTVLHKPVKPAKLRAVIQKALPPFEPSHKQGGC